MDSVGAGHGPAPTKICLRFINLDNPMDMIGHYHKFIYLDIRIVILKVMPYMDNSIIPSVILPKIGSRFFVQMVTK